MAAQLLLEGGRWGCMDGGRWDGFLDWLADNGLLTSKMQSRSAPAGTSQPPTPPPPPPPPILLPGPECYLL